MMNNKATANLAAEKKELKSQTSLEVSTAIRERGGLKSLTAIRNLPIGKYEAIKALEMLPR